MEAVVIRWFDSAIAPSTLVYTPSEVASETLIELEVIGWLLKETDEPHGGHYTIAASSHGGEDWRGVQLIPKVNVIEISRMKKGRE